MKTKKEVQDQNQSIEQEVINLGFVQNLAKKVSANQLAAAGIQLSVRENLISFIKSMDKVGNNEKDLLTALQNSQPDQQVPSMTLENAGSSSLNIIPPEADADEGGLIFYDPHAEMLAKKE